MKKEILRIHNLNYDSDIKIKLKNISFFILEGERVAFLGLTRSGKEVLLRLLSGKEMAENRNIKIYVDGEKRSVCDLGKRVYLIESGNYNIKNWNVAEYLYLVDSSWKDRIRGEKGIVDRARRTFEKFSITIDVTKRIEDLTELEKRVMDMIKARETGAKIVIIQDDFDGMDYEAIHKFSEVIKTVISEKMSVIVDSNSDTVVSALADQYVIFKDGIIVKKCKKEYIKDLSQMQKYLFGTKEEKMLHNRYSDEKKKLQINKVVYKVRGLKLGTQEEFDFFKGNIVTFLILNKKEKERIFNELSGRVNDSGVEYITDSSKFNRRDKAFFTREKIVSIKQLGSKKELFRTMSVVENLLMPSLSKFSFWDFVLNAKKLTNVLMENLWDSKIDPNLKIDELDINDIINVTLERWHIYNPKVMIMYEPFALCDANGVSIVKSHIKKFANNGTSIVIINTRDENVSEISNQLMELY